MGGDICHGLGDNVDCMISGPYATRYNIYVWGVGGRNPKRRAKHILKWCKSRAKGVQPICLIASHLRKGLGLTSSQHFLTI